MGELVQIPSSWEWSEDSKTLMYLVEGAKWSMGIHSPPKIFFSPIDIFWIPMFPLAGRRHMDIRPRL